jgi:hypothetical protein
VKDGIRTRDPWNHNPVLLPTELLSPLKTIGNKLNLPPHPSKLIFYTKPSCRQRPILSSRSILVRTALGKVRAALGKVRPALGKVRLAPGKAWLAPGKARICRTSSTTISTRLPALEDSGLTNFFCKKTLLFVVNFGRHRKIWKLATKDNYRSNVSIPRRKASFSVNFQDSDGFLSKN